MTILAAVGEERRISPVVSTAYNLALASGDDLVVLHVVPDDDFEEHRRALERITDFEGYSFTQAEGSAARVAREVFEATVGIFDEDVASSAGRVGDPVEEILAAVEAVGARYLVIGGRRRSPASKAVFGSVSQSVLLNAAVPTLTVMLD